VHVRRLVLLPAIALLAGSLLTGRANISPTRAADSLPPCRYRDIVTAYHAPADWRRTLVDTTFMVPRTYEPPDLVPVSQAGVAGNGSVRELVIPDLAALAAAARAAGTPIAVESAYRSYIYQVSVFQGSVNQIGYGAALLVSARPGHSEHQLGLAIDFRSGGGAAPWDDGDWAKTPAGAWMKANAWKFGFVMSYPSDTAKPTTCYGYEPWHYRYVGRDVAAAIHTANITTREYLWYSAGNSVMAGLLGSTPPSQVPTTEATAIASPSPTTTPVPAATASLLTRTRSAGAVGPASGRPAEPISPAGASLAIGIGLAILVAVEQLDREMRSRWRLSRGRPARRAA